MTSSFTGTSGMVLTVEPTSYATTSRFTASVGQPTMARGPFTNSSGSRPSVGGDGVS